MSVESPKTLSEDDIRKINSVLARDQSVEVKPTKDGVRVFHVKREEIKAAGAEIG